MIITTSTLEKVLTKLITSCAIHMASCLVDIQQIPAVLPPPGVSVHRLEDMLPLVFFQNNIFCSGDPLEYENLMTQMAVLFICNI